LEQGLPLDAGRIIMSTELLALDAIAEWQNKKSYRSNPVAS